MSRSLKRGVAAKKTKTVSTQELFLRLYNVEMEFFIRKKLLVARLLSLSQANEIVFLENPHSHLQWLVT